MADPLTHSHDTATPALSVDIEEALRPFADAVFNDNGDMTVTPVYGREAYVNAYFAHKRLTAPNPSPAAKGGEAEAVPTLLSCPFCGGAPTLHPHSPDHKLGAWVSCSTCGLESPTETGRSVEAAVQHWNTRAALTPPETAEAVPPLYLIRKGGAFYRPNSQGYTRSIAEAGRYSLAEAEAITHPNGPNGPRDGMDYIPAPALASDPAPATDDRERLVEAFIAGATAVHEEIKRDHPEAVPRGDPEFYEAAQDYARAALATEASR